MIINDLDGYYIVFDTKNWNTELDTLVVISTTTISTSPFSIFSCITDRVGDSVCYDLRSSRDVWKNFYIFCYTGRFYNESSSLFS